MEPSKEKLEIDIALLEKATATLVEALKQPFDDFMRGAIIQRFEYVFELAWKTLRSAADYFGAELTTPREAIQFGFQKAWIDDPDSWFDAMKARNKTSHTYNVEIANEVYQIAKTFAGKAQSVLDALKKI